jgi:hypothetical protein
MPVSLTAKTCLSVLRLDGQYFGRRHENVPASFLLQRSSAFPLN